MKTNKNDCCGNGVTLDLNELKITLAIGARHAKTQKEKYQHEIDDYLELAYRAKNHDDHYHALVRVHTTQEHLKQATEDYCRILDQYFYVCQAIDREEVKIERVMPDYQAK